MATPKKAGQPWTAEADQELARLNREGTPTREMARIFGRSEGAIKSRLSKHTNARTGTLPHLGAVRTPVPRNTTSDSIVPSTSSRARQPVGRQSYKRWTIDDDPTLHDMEANHVSVPEMADRLGRTTGAITSRLSKHTDAREGTLPERDARRHTAPTLGVDINSMMDQLQLSS